MTHHGALDELREDSPSAAVLDQTRVVDNGKIIMSAGVSAGIDAALYTVAQFQGLKPRAGYRDSDLHGV